MIESWEKITLSEKLRQSAKIYESRIALSDGSSKLTYKELIEKIEILAMYFIDTGIKKGDKVLVQLPNRNLVVIVYFALFEIGAIPVLLLPAQREIVINGICEVAKPCAYISMSFFGGVDYGNTAVEIIKKNQCIKYVFYDEQLESMLSNKSAETEIILSSKPESGDVAFLSLSGGTTGVPKLIPRTNEDYVYNAKITSKHCNITEETVMLTVIPIAHNFALGTPGMIGTLIKGGKVVMCEYPSPIEIFEIISREKVTMMSLVPTLVNLCIKYREIDKRIDIESLRYLLVGGAMFRAEFAEKVEKSLDVTLIQVYGMAEGMTFLTDLNDDKEIRYTTQGKPCSPYDEFIIVDENGKEVEDGVEGEIFVKGPYTISHYYGNIDANKLSFKDGYYCTGDRGVKLDSGNIRICGRVKEQINRAGEKIMPAELEQYVMKHPKVKECIIVGLNDELLGTKICAFIISDEEINLKELMRFLEAERVAQYYLPDEVIRVDRFPLTPVGKIDKNKLITMMEE